MWRRIGIDESGGAIHGRGAVIRVDAIRGEMHAFQMAMGTGWNRKGGGCVGIRHEWEREKERGLRVGLPAGWTEDGRGEGIRSEGKRGGRVQGAINSEIALAR